MLLYIVRHGEPNYTTDTLTDRGWLQAEAVGKRMFDAGIDRIFSSPMGRAKQTAEPACRLLGKEYTVEPWAHEIGDEVNVEFPDGKFRAIGYLPNIRFFEYDNLYRPYEDYKELLASGTCDVVIIATPQHEDKGKRNHRKQKKTEKGRVVGEYEAIYW